MIRIERHGAVAVVVLDRPEARNALSSTLRQALNDALQALETDPDVRVLVLTGEGKVFCAGLDLKELGASETAIAELRGHDPRYNPVEALARVTKPVIGAINGAAVTGGFELALACDLLIASDEARFADTHLRVGLLPIWGMSQRLPRLIGLGRAKEMSLTGNYIDARTAEAWGLVNRVVPAVELMTATLALAQDMASNSLPGLLAYNWLINEGLSMPFEQALAFERDWAGAANAGATPEELAARRDAVVVRGRTQSRTENPADLSPGS